MRLRKWWEQEVRGLSCRALDLEFAAEEDALAKRLLTDGKPV